MAAVGVVLLALLKLLGILVLVLLGLLVLVLLVPACVWMDYSHEIFSLWVGVPGLRFQLLGKPDTLKKAARRAKRLARKEAARAKKDAKRSRKPQPATAQKPKREQLKLTADQIFLLVGDAGFFFRAVLGALRITHIRICMPVHCEDAADTAIRYGKTQAWLHSGLAVLNRFIWLQFDECRLLADYTGKMTAQEHYSCKISAQLYIIGIAAVRVLLLLKKQAILDLLV